MTVPTPTADAPAAAAPTGDTSEPDARPPLFARRWVWFAAATLAVCWWAALATLAATRANMPILNAAQFLASDAAAVVGVADDGAATVERVLWGGVAEGPLALPAVDAGAGTFVVPLTRRGGGWAVTPVDPRQPSRGAGLVPADDATVARALAVRGGRAG